MTERAGKVSIRGRAMTFIGNELTPGQPAPDFRCRTGFGPEATVTLADSKGKVRVFNVVPSLDTGVCEKQTIRFNQEAAAVGEKVRIITVSMDLPPAQTRFCGVQLHGDVMLQMLSDYAEKSFGINYGILLKEWQVLGRGIFIVDDNDILRYVEYCPDISQLPNFDAALDALRKVVS
jgi:thiol peroxidase